MYEFELDYGGLYRAFVQALSPQEICDCYLHELDTPSLKRRYLGRQIIQDASSEFQSYHEHFVRQLFRQFDDLKYPVRVSCAYLLGDMYGFMSSDLQDELIDLLLHSGYAPIRRRCYELLDRHWRPSFQSVAEESWHRKKESASARLAVKRLPPEFLVTNFDELHELIKPHEITQLYARASEKDPRILERLKGSDDITYAYILQKCGQKVRGAEALAMVDRNIDNDRLGLLVWCLGRMGLWNVLNVIYEDAKKDVFKYRRLHW